MDYESLIFELMDVETAVGAGAIVDLNGNLLYQTENWEISGDLAKIVSIIEEAQKPDGANPGRIEVMKITYMVVEFTPERVIATNVTRKGHIIISIGKKGAIVAYIDPSAGPRDALFNVQAFTMKL